MICDRCLHNNICGNEGAFEDALTYCADFLGWIPVSERLPEEKHCCLCCDKDRYITIGFISKSKEWCFVDDEIDIDVIAWMPLPKPYEPQESEEL